jgi:hypothetical protein
MKTQPKHSQSPQDPCEIIEDPVVKHLCNWCSKREIPTDEHDEVSFWLTFDVPAIDRNIPLKVRRDGKWIKYRFDYNQVFPPKNENDPKLETYIDALEYFLNERVADPYWRFTLVEIDGKRIVRGRCWREAREGTALLENELELLLVIRHAIKVISDADHFFGNNGGANSNDAKDG